MSRQAKDVQDRCIAGFSDTTCARLALLLKDFDSVLFSHCIRAVMQPFRGYIGICMFACTTLKNVVELQGCGWLDEFPGWLEWLAHCKIGLIHSVELTKLSQQALYAEYPCQEVSHTPQL